MEIQTWNFLLHGDSAARSRRKAIWIYWHHVPNVNSITSFNFTVIWCLLWQKVRKTKVDCRGKIPLYGEMTASRLMMKYIETYSWSESNKLSDYFTSYFNLVDNFNLRLSKEKYSAMRAAECEWEEVKLDGPCCEFNLLFEICLILRTTVEYRKLMKLRQS